MASRDPDDAPRMAQVAAATARQIEAARYAPKDRVRVLPDGELPTQWIGREGIVLEVTKRGAWPVRIELDPTPEHAGGTHRFAPDQLEKIGPGGEGHREESDAKNLVGRWPFHHPR